jgi:hypothetical protein
MQLINRPLNADVMPEDRRDSALRAGEKVATRSLSKQL